MKHTRRVKRNSKTRKQKRRMRGGQVIPMTVEIAKAILQKRNELKARCEASAVESKFGGLQKKCPDGCVIRGGRCGADYRIFTAKEDPQYEITDVDQVTGSSGELVKKVKKESQILDSDLTFFIDMAERGY